MPDHIPFLLMPVKVETKFAHSATGANELWVRFFPDTVAVYSHEEELMEAEVEAGQHYWTNIWEARNGNSEEQATARRGAWNTLANRYGPHRSLWIAKQTRPLNWQDDLASMPQPSFPEPGPIKTASWTLAPRTRVMPDRFVVSTFRKFEGKMYQALPPVVGAHVPDTLILGPDPSQLDGEFGRDAATGELKLDPAMAWLADFDKAVQVGMGVRIPLPAPWNTNGFDRLVVLGLRLSTDAEDSAKLVEELMNNHHYTGGIAFLPQGTPTNNTEEAGSGYTTLDPSNEASFNAQANAADPASWSTLFNSEDKKDGQRFAEALGLEYDTSAPIENANGEDVAEAIAMNAALWHATWGDFLKEMMGTAFNTHTIQQIQGFFQRHVTGRGSLPAFRVGSQPYGVLVTSDFGRWQWSAQEIIEEEQFYNGLLLRLRQLMNFWKAAIFDVKHAGDGSEPFQRLLEILGLHATSVDYFSRKAVAGQYAWNYYNFRGWPFSFIFTAWETLQKEKTDSLNAIGLGNFKDLKIKDLTFFKNRTHLYGPVVDGDPDVPLSETLGIRPFFDDTATGVQRNYIHWLLNSSKNNIEKEIFADATGKAVPPPKALLYMLLRQAFLNGLTNVGKNYLLAEKVVSEIPANPYLLNMTGQQHISNKELLNVTPPKLGAELGETIVNQLHLPPNDNFHFTFAPMLEVRHALQKLAGLPTARLERLFAEHVDLCSYRIDAWVTGLFQRRLERQRAQINPGGVAAGEPGKTYTRGVYLGAYGWVEDLHPRAQKPQPVSPGMVPQKLLKPEKGPIVASDANGGYVLAPSLNHAVTAAVLRNAYISHAQKDNNSPFSVNLSSRRVRMAMSYLEGLRNGQSLAALLGYQFERALHDNPEHEELDEFIYVFRDRFPFISGKLSEVPDGTPAEAVEANNVVNGYDLLQFAKGKTYPYGLPVSVTNNLPLAGSSKAKILAREIDRLTEALDAIGDLALTESVHQVVQGNYERAGGMLQAISEGAPPPEPDFVNTPRNGKTITQRVAFTFDPAAADTAPGWGATATLRSTANAPVNDWLGTMLPAPAEVGFAVTIGAAAPKNVALSQYFDLQPSDCVLMAGNNLGDESSELERYLIYKIKKAGSLTEADEVKIDFKTAGAGKTALYFLQPLLRSLRRVITEARPMHAQDLMTGIEGQKADAANPQGYEAGLTAFRLRVQAVYDVLQNETDEAGTGLAHFYKTQIEAPFQLYFDDPDHVIEAAWEGRLNQIRERLLPLVQHALPEALPATISGFERPALESLVSQVQVVLKILQKRLKEVDDGELLKPLAADPNWKPAEKGAAIGHAIASYGEAAKILLNKSFVALPHFSTHNPDELNACLAQNIEPDELEVEKWLQGMGKVREKMANLTTLATTHDLLTNGTFGMSPLQVPFNAGGRWIGKEFGEDYDLQNDTVSVMLHTATPPAFDAQLCGLLLEEWTEVIPERAINAGISFHFDRPNAMPPQTLLLAVPPQIKGHWTWDDLIAILQDTLDRSKLRAVEPDQLAKSPAFQTLPAVLTEFTSFNFATVLANNVILREGTLAEIAPDTF
ncbi:MAG: hypothetical protein EPO28_17505 [Saprospiraceae bacterium]|nr:MAG: hypothetical protein EPO28_17505 [Saprospiraceae bacterium]